MKTLRDNLWVAVFSTVNRKLSVRSRMINTYHVCIGQLGIERWNLAHNSRRPSPRQTVVQDEVLMVDALELPLRGVSQEQEAGRQERISIFLIELMLTAYLPANLLFRIAVKVNYRPGFPSGRYTVRSSL